MRTAFNTFYETYLSICIWILSFSNNSSFIENISFLYIFYSGILKLNSPFIEEEFPHEHFQCRCESTLKPIKYLIVTFCMVMSFSFLFVFSVMTDITGISFGSIEVSYLFCLYYEPWNWSLRKRMQMSEN